MAKKGSAFLSMLEARHRRDVQRQRLFTIQQCKDLMLITMHVEFGFGPDRIKRLAEAFDEMFDRFVDMALDDDQDGDHDLTYCFAKLDQALEEACGENYVPREVRYAFMQMI